MVGTANPNYRAAGSRSCAQCSEAYHSYDPRSKYCSPSCYHASKPRKAIAKQIAAPLFKRPRETLPKVTWLAWCRECRKGFKRRGTNAAKNKFCSYPCFISNGGAVRAGMESSKMTRKYGAKKDANHNAIVDVLKKTNTWYADMSGVGFGMPDLIVACDQETLHFWEIKNRATSYGKRGLNPKQIAWANDSQGPPVYIIESVDDAVRFINGERAHVKGVGGYKAGAVTDEMIDSAIARVRSKR